MDEKFELACFQIITYVGTARTQNKPDRCKSIIS